jgi:hypothetical protein
MKALTVLIYSLLSLTLYGQQTKAAFDGHTWQAPYNLPIPKDWTIERFLIPISFAPQISYTGVEDIRFTPGWGNAKSEEYWSYAFLWYLDGKIKTNTGVIERNLKSYYTGLIGINGREIPAGKLIPVSTSFKKVKKNTGDLKTYAGTIEMLDYMNQQPIVLHCKVHLQYDLKENKTFIFHELSPQPFSHSVWQRLDNLWLDFKKG